MSFLFVALGGAIGAMGRYAISLFPIKNGFTTFSTFSLEAFTLLENKAYLLGGVYIVLSVVGCIIGVLCGKKLAMLVQ